MNTKRKRAKRLLEKERSQLLARPALWARNATGFFTDYCDQPQDCKRGLNRPEVVSLTGVRNKCKEG
jgi:hypothetical protein